MTPHFHQHSMMEIQSLLISTPRLVAKFEKRTLSDFHSTNKTFLAKKSSFLSELN
jgi:hypothetical protein